MAFPLAAVLISALGTALQMNAQAKAARRQENTLRRADEATTGYQNQALKVLQDTLQQYAPEQRQQNLDDTAAQLQGQYTQQIDRADEQGYGGVRPLQQGRTSSTYDTSLAESSARSKQNALELARIMAKVAAPNRLRSGEGFNVADMNSQLGTLGSFAAGTGNAAAAKASTIGADPGSMVLGGLLQSAGSYAGNTSSAGSSKGSAWTNPDTGQIWRY